MPIFHTRPRDGLPIVGLESDWLCVKVAPGVGGRIVSLRDRKSGYEFLWRNQALRLERKAPGSPYDPHFYGGIDELLPNDLAESWDGLTGLDHGELWTSSLDWKIANDRLILSGTLPGCGLEYERSMQLSENRPCFEFTYRIRNGSQCRRRFLWKLHAALTVEEGDVMDCPARFGQVVDPAWSRFKNTAPFPWPMMDGGQANVVPPANGTMDFFYLYELRSGQVAWRRPRSDLVFGYRFDLATFPYCWLFASYGGFEGHYTVVLEPCTAMPLSVAEAARLNQCSILEPGAVLETRVELWAGRGRDLDFLLTKGGSHA
jgi:hypothetical protein